MTYLSQETQMITINISGDRFNSFYNQNPALDILNLNFLNEKANNFNWKNLEP